LTFFYAGNQDYISSGIKGEAVGPEDAAVAADISGIDVFCFRLSGFRLSCVSWREYYISSGIKGEAVGPEDAAVAADISGLTFFYAWREHYGCSGLGGRASCDSGGVGLCF
jgi:hypothetical protein